jgi:geranylgeranyl diphosphate synthase type II
MLDIKLYLEQERDRINRVLENSLAPAEEPSAVLEAMRYSVSAGGKRLRPLLTLAAAKTLGEESEQVLEVACAVEYIHTYSLIHDDLPAMDDSNLRRGKPACHRVFGEAVAILAGDALLTMAFERLALYGLKSGRERAALMISSDLAQASGAAGMIGGQALDLQAERRALNAEELERMHSLKTGAMIKAAVRCGALASEATAAELRALTGYGACLGLAYQIVDDLLDRERGAEELGKPAGADQIRAKATYPALLGDTAARQRAETLHHDSLVHLKSLGRPAEILQGLADCLIFRTW